MFKQAFPDINMDEAAEETEEDHMTFIMYLWPHLEPIYNIYKILIDYLIDNQNIDSTLLLALIHDKQLPLPETLTYVSYIHFGYLTSILKK